MIQLDTRLPLMAQGPNVLAAMDAGTVAAGNTANLLRQAEGQNLFRQYGAGAMQGDPTAMNALAGFDPVMAQGMDINRQENRRADQRLAIDQERLSIVRQETARAVRESQDRAEAESQVRMLQNAFRQMHIAKETGDTRTLMQGLAMFGVDQLPPEKGMEVAASMLAGGIEGLTAQYMPQAPAQPTADMQNLEFRAREAGLVPGSPEYKEFMARGGKTDGGMSLRVTPDGGVEFGTGGGVQNLTERQSVIALFGSMMDQTMPVINQLEQRFDPSNLQDNLAARAGWTGNYVRSEDAQKYAAAANAWAEAVLRIQTGAAATQPEIERVVATYFAQPGDDAATIQYKRTLRDQYATAVSAASGGRFEPPGQGAATTEPAPPPDPTPTPTTNLYPTFDAFSASQTMQNAAKAAGVTLEDMWEVYQKQQSEMRGQ